jgi:hypothetical protein
MKGDNVMQEIVLDLQALEVPEDVDFFGNSGTSSPGGCCNLQTAG